MNAAQKEKQKEKRRTKHRAPYPKKNKNELQILKSNKINRTPRAKWYLELRVKSTWAPIDKSSSGLNNKINNPSNQNNIDDHKNTRQVSASPEAAADYASNSTAADASVNVETVTQDALQITEQEFDDLGNFTQN